MYAKREPGTWVQFKRVTNTVAAEPIDSYIVYRMLSPNSRCSYIKGIFQRDLETFETSVLVTRRDGTFRCFNCHTFCQNNPDKFIYYIRRGQIRGHDGRGRRQDTED